MKIESKAILRRIRNLEADINLFVIVGTLIG